MLLSPVILTSTFSSLLVDFPEDESICNNNDDQRKEIHCNDVKNVIGHLMGCTGKEVESHTLFKPLVFRVLLHVKYHTLKI